MSKGLIISIIFLFSMIAMTIEWSYIEPFTDSDSSTIANDGSNASSSEKKINVAVASLVRKPSDISIWLDKLREIGVVHFFLRIEDTVELKEFLMQQSDVTFEMGASSKGNNYESLQRRQIDFVNKSIKSASAKGIDWIFHIDSDELLEGSFDFLDTLDPSYKCVKIENVEAIYNEDEESCFSSKKFIKCSKSGAMCRSYVNGKSGGLVSEHLRLAGPHDFSYKGDVGGDTTYRVPFEDLHVLHFDSCTFGSWVEKFKHLSKEGQGIPFRYYNDSIKQVQNAYNTYKEYTMSNIDINKDHIHVI